MQNESRILIAIRNALGRLPHVRLFRNNSGTFKDARGVYITFGVPPIGGSDLLGWRVLTITQDMVGKRVAQFLAIEVKTATGKATKEQLNFIRAVQQAGGIAGVVRSLQEAEQLCQQPPQP